MSGTRMWVVALASCRPLQSRWFRQAAIAAFLLLTGAPGAPSRAAGTREPNPAEMARLIDKVRENEMRFANFDSTVTISRIYYPEPPGNRAGQFSLGASVLKATDETDRVSIRGSRYFFSGEEVHSLTSGDKVTTKRMATFDGTQTVAIEEDNSATVYHGRYEPAHIAPPHAWGIFTLEVNFPLSVYLQGTAAIKSHNSWRARLWLSTSGLPGALLASKISSGCPTFPGPGKRTAPQMWPWSESMLRGPNATQ